MNATLARRALAWWFAILVLAFLNGGLCERLLVPALGRVTAQVLSGLLLSGLILFVAWLALPRLAPLTARQCWAIGGAWLLLTLAFEFSFGVFVQQQPLAVLLRAYTFADGNIWPLVLLFTLAAPRLAARLRGPA